MEYVERWRSVLGYCGRYEVSDFGRVQSFVLPANPAKLRREPVILTGDRQRYISVVLCQEDGRTERKYVHQLVLDAFVGPAPVGYEGAHCDGDGQNNCLANLAWKTPAENAADKKRHGTDNAGERHPMAKLTETEVLEIRNAPGFHKHIAASYGVSTSLIGMIKSRKIWSHV